MSEKPRSGGTSKTMSEKPTILPTSSVLKEQFALIAILVVLIGTVYTDYYYAKFGLRYQSLNLPATHILYRGFTVLRDAPYVALPYLLSAVWLIVEGRMNRHWWTKNRLAISYVVVAIVLASSYWLASAAGYRSAVADLSEKSPLPKIRQLIGSSGMESPCAVPDACRLLLIDGDYIYVFSPTANKSSVSTVIRLDKKAFSQIITSTY